MKIWFYTNNKHNLYLSLDGRQWENIKQMFNVNSSIFWERTKTNNGHQSWGEFKLHII